MTATCFTEQQLEKYLHGRIDEEVSDAIEMHVPDCQRCEDRLSRMESQGGDTLIRTLQITPPNTSKTELPSWIRPLSERSIEAETETKAAPERDEIPVPTLGDYELTQIIGRGGMSVVYGGFHQRLGREVAVKLMLPHSQPNLSRDRFVREMRTVGQLNHPNIAQATDAGEFNGKMFLVMERIRGVNLNRLIKEIGPLPPEHACHIAIEIATALAHAHELGIVHRDVKPSNVMLRLDGKIKILDFGLARSQASAGNVSLQTTMGQLIGTLDYMAPEQAAGGDVEARADVYGLGATLYKLLTGIAPHGRSADRPVIEFLNRLATESAKPLRQIRPAIQPELASAVDEMLKTNPDERTASMDDVISRLRPFASTTDLQSLFTQFDHFTSTPPTDEDKADVLESLADYSRDSTPTEGSSATIEPPNRPPTLASTRAAVRNRKPRWPRILIAIGLVAVVMSAIMLTLKTPKGQIVIESAIDDVELTFVGENDRVDHVDVEQGVNSTKIRTGQYQIKIKSPLDNIDVSPSHVVITKDKIFKIVVSKVDESKESSNPDRAQPSITRDGDVMLRARIDLRDAMQELQQAQSQADPDDTRIRSIEERIRNLRALSTPIPTEPVYQGRTLADWVAQMTYERDRKARETAAKSVIRLADTLPPEEALDTIVKAHLITWTPGKPLASPQHRTRSYFERELESAPTPSEAAIRFLETDLALAAPKLGRLILGDPNESSFGQMIALEIRQQIQNDASWRPAIDALKQLIASPPSNSPYGSVAERPLPQSITKVIYAACVPDVSEALHVLDQLDPEDAAPDAYKAAVYVVDRRKLPQSSAKRNRLLAQYITSKYGTRTINLTYAYRSDQPLQWAPLTNLPGLESIGTRTTGPLPDLNHLAVALMDLIQVSIPNAGSARNVEIQPKLAVQVAALMGCARSGTLNANTANRATTVLQHRLAQVVRFRNMGLQETLTYNPPALIASTIYRLTGQLPDAIRPGKSDLPTAVDEHLMSIYQHGHISSDTVIGNLSLQTVAENYPMEFIDVAKRSLPNRSRRMVKVPPALVLASEIESGSQLGVQRLISANSLFPLTQRHKKIAQVVETTLTIGKPSAILPIVFATWAMDRSVADTNAKLLLMIKSESPNRIRFAIEELKRRPHPADRGGNPNSFRLEWEEPIAAAIDRLAEMTKLQSRDFDHLFYLDNAAPNAAKHAANSVVQFLTDEVPAEAQGEAPSLRMISILKRDRPLDDELVAQLQAILQRPDLEVIARRSRAHLNLIRAVQLIVEKETTDD